MYDIRTLSRMLISFYFNVFIMYYLESVYKIIIIMIIPMRIKKRVYEVIYGDGDPIKAYLVFFRGLQFLIGAKIEF